MASSPTKVISPPETPAVPTPVATIPTPASVIAPYVSKFMSDLSKGAIETVKTKAKEALKATGVDPLVFQNIIGVTVDTFADFFKISKDSKGLNALKEYTAIFVLIIFTLIAYFKPTFTTFDTEEWSSIGGLALLFVNVLYGGLLKNNITKQLTYKEAEYKALGESLQAHKDALNKQCEENSRVQNELALVKKEKDLEVRVAKQEAEFWQRRYLESNPVAPKA